MVTDTKIKKEYKQTDLGVIPEDWDVKEFRNIAMITRGASPRPIDSPIWFDEKSKIGWVRISDVSKSTKFLRHTTQKLSELGVKSSRFVGKGSLIMSICATVGRPILTGLDVCIHDGFVVFADPKIEKEYLYYFLSFIEDEWSKNGQTGSQMNLNTELINYTQIAFPKSKPEQSAIVAILSDTDALIERLEKLIAKKKAIKQGTMQQLLTSKKRLPGFSGEWGMVPLKNLIQVPVTDGPHLTPKFLQEGIPFLSVNNLANNRIDYSNLRYISKHDHDVFSRKCKPQKEDILLGKAASVGLVAVVDSDFDFNIWSPIALIRLSDQHVPKFIYYSFQCRYVINQIKLLTNSSSQGNIGMGDIEEIDFLVPTKEEQIAIATILSDMDEEIKNLEQKRDKYTLLLKGMMQQLLTGRIRIHATN
jgi:type I restriction enzyme S subunit